MRRYEVVFVLAPTTAEEQARGLVEAYSNTATEMGATVLNVEEWGKRQLAFPVKKFSDGLYYILTIEEPGADAARELERRFKVSDAVIRFLTVRIDEDLRRAEKFKSKREAKSLRKKKAASSRRQTQRSRKPEEQTDDSEEAADQDFGDEEGEE